MISLYYCPYCDQHSTRRWNLEIHIQRRHDGIGQPIHKMPDGPLQSSGKPVSNNWLGDFHNKSPGKPVSNNWLGDFHNKSRAPNNIFSTSDDNPLDLQRFVIESLRNMRDKRFALAALRSPCSRRSKCRTAYECMFLRLGYYFGIQGACLQEMLVSWD